jgi:hypothetical protein
VNKFFCKLRKADFYIQVDMAFAICAVYLVDVMQSRSSEILAAIKFVLFFFFFYWPFYFKEFFFLDSIMRSVLGATTIATILPMIDAYGAAVTYLLFTIIVWMSYGYVCCSFRKLNKWIR